MRNSDSFVAACVRDCISDGRLDTAESILMMCEDTLDRETFASLYGSICMNRDLV